LYLAGDVESDHHQSCAPFENFTLWKEGKKISKTMLALVGLFLMSRILVSTSANAAYPIL
jgi:hypothetical protein